MGAGTARGMLGVFSAKISPIAAPGGMIPCRTEKPVIAGAPSN